MLRVTLRSKNFRRNFQIDPQVDYRTGHPKKYTIRRKDNRQRFLYQKYKEEILMDQITQPHYPSSHKNPGWNVPQKQYYGIWFSQRPSASVGVTDSI